MGSLADDLWRRLKNLKLELLRLKQKKRAGTTSRYYTYKVFGDNYYNAWLITYENGNQPIITEVLSYYDTSLSTPSNNQQYIFSFSQASAELTVLSTRKITRVNGITIS